MSKIKVNNIETSSADVKLASKGTGLVKVKGANTDATLKLSAGTNGVKIKSPAHSAGQSYTMILPDNNIEAGKALKVKSVSGDVGQLEFASIAASNLSANIIDSGTLAAARIPNLATKGSALELVSKQTVGSTDVTDITFTGLEDDTMYKMVAKYLNCTSPAGTWYMNWLDSSGSIQDNVTYERFFYSSTSSHDTAGSQSSTNSIRLSGANFNTLAFVADISNIAANNWMTVWAVQPGYSIANKHEVYASFNPSGAAQRIHGIKLYNTGSNTGITSPSEVLLYKYRES